MSLELNFPHPIVVFDTETGGLNPDDEINWSLERKKYVVGSEVKGKLVALAAPILEIGAVLLDPHSLKEIGSFHTLCGPEKDESFDEFLYKCKPEALRINGFENRLDELKKAPPLSQALKDFSKFLPRSGNRVGRFIPCGQNVRYDIDMLNMACLRYGVDLSIKTQPLELISYSLVYFSIPDTQVVANYKLSTVAEALGVSTEGLHTALADVKMTAECLRIFFERFST